MMDNNTTSDTGLTPEHTEALRQKLQAFLSHLAALALGFSNKLRLFFLLSLLSASWLTFFIHRLFELSLWGLLLAFLGLSLPALSIWQMRRTVQKVIVLPEIFPAITACFKTVLATAKNDTVNRLSALKAPASNRFKLKELAVTGRQLVGLMKLLTALRNQLGGIKSEVIESAIIVASPGFVIAMSIATTSTIILTLAAGITAIVFQFIG